MVAAEAEKNFRECTIKLWPIAVVSNPSNSRYGNCDENAERSKKKRTGIKTMVITVVKEFGMINIYIWNLIDYLEGIWQSEMMEYDWIMNEEW